MFTVVVTDLEEADVRQANIWWRDNRSGDQASRWYKSVRRAIATLRDIADRCAPALEVDLHPLGLRQLLFGIGRRPTHRIIFVIEGSQATVYRVRHTAQAMLEPDDLPAS